MKLSHQEYTYYTYLRISTKEDWQKCLKNLVSKMKRKGYRLNMDEHSINILAEPCDYYDNGSCGASLYFIKR